MTPVAAGGGVTGNPNTFFDNALLVTVVGAILGPVAARLLPQKGFEATLSWTRGLGSPLGGYFGRNTITRYAQEALQDIGQGLETLATALASGAPSTLPKPQTK